VELKRERRKKEIHRSHKSFDTRETISNEIPPLRPVRSLKTFPASRWKVCTFATALLQQHPAIALVIVGALRESRQRTGNEHASPSAIQAASLRDEEIKENKINVSIDIAESSARHARASLMKTAIFTLSSMYACART